MSTGYILLLNSAIYLHMQNRLLFITSAILMVVLGTSDALRGIFSPLFLNSFGFSESEVGLIVSASYFGNLVFLLLGGVIIDRIGIKKSMITFSILMMLSLLLLLFGYVYAILVAGFFLTLGLSTLLNTTINIASDSFSSRGSLVYLNVLFFIQGIGTSGSQFLLSPYSESTDVWNATLIVLAAVLIPVLIMLSRTRVKGREDARIITEGEGKTDYMGLFFLVLTLSFYTIAEHGVTNYIISYGLSLGRESAEMGRYLALYSLGIMSGRLILGAIIERVGTMRMVLISLAVGTLSFFLIFFFSALPLTLLAGFAISTLYPTLVALSRRYASPSHSSRITTIVVSLASIFDIIFNFSFGFIIESAGFNMSMRLLPLMMVLAIVSILPLMKGKRA